MRDDKHSEQRSSSPTSSNAPRGGSGGDRKPQGNSNFRSAGGNSSERRQGGGGGGQYSSNRPQNTNSTGGSSYNTQSGDRPARPLGDRPVGDRPVGDRPMGDRPARPVGDRPMGDRPARPVGDRPMGTGSRPPHAAGGNRPAGSGGGYAGNRPAFNGGAPRPASSAPARKPQSASSQMQRPAHDGPRMNEMITVKEILLIDQDGNKIGNMAIREALNMALDAGLDLVEIAPNGQPPVCKIMDYGKHKYQEQKKATEARKKQKIVEIKEIKMRPNIDDHDYDVKLKAIARFLEEGNKVKITLKFRGRELSHTDIGMKVLERIQEDSTEMGRVELAPKVDGRQAIMILAPASVKVV